MLLFGNVILPVVGFGKGLNVNELFGKGFEISTNK